MPQIYYGVPLVGYGLHLLCSVYVASISLVAVITRPKRLACCSMNLLRHQFSLMFDVGSIYAYGIIVRILSVLSSNGLMLGF